MAFPTKQVNNVDHKGQSLQIILNKKILSTIVAEPQEAGLFGRSRSAMRLQLRSGSNGSVPAPTALDRHGSGPTNGIKNC
jgi:hypothetical protein